MPALFESSTPLWLWIEYARIDLRTRSEQAAAGMTNYLLGQGGVTNMERLCSMSEKEIRAIPLISKANYRYVQEAIDDFKAQYGDPEWKMPDFDDVEVRYILHELAYRKPPHYYDLVHSFHNMSQDQYFHQQIEVMARIYCKMASIHRDEFAAIMAGKNISLDKYRI